MAVTERALAATERALGPEHLQFAIVLLNLSLLQAESGDFEAAARTAERGLAVRSKTFPPDHPEIAVALGALAGVRWQEARDDEAEALYQQVARIREKALGPDSVKLAFIRNHLALLAADRGDTATARRLIDVVLPVKRKAYGEHHLSTAYAYRGLGAVLLQEKNPAAARAAYEKSIAIQLEKGDEPSDVHKAMLGLADVELADGKPAEAIAQLERAKQILDKKPTGLNRFLVVPVVVGLGRAHLAAGHQTEAIAFLQRAIGMADTNGAPSRFEGARARFHLARALWTSNERSRRHRTGPLRARGPRPQGGSRGDRALAEAPLASLTPGAHSWARARQKGAASAGRAWAARSIGSGTVTSQRSPPSRTRPGSTSSVTVRCQSSVSRSLRVGSSVTASRVIARTRRRPGTSKK